MLNDRIQNLADAINDSVVYKQQIWAARNEGDWDKFWASFTNICDTQEVVDEWKSIDEPQKLALYGVLQALVIQQDAVRHMQESLNLEPVHIKNDYPILHAVRIARNKIAGHPTDIDSKNGKGSYKSGTKSYLTLGFTQNSKTVRYSVASNSGDAIETLSLLDAIAEQEAFLESEIGAVIAKVYADDKAYKSQYADGKLADTLHNAHYFISKLYSFERDKTYSGICFSSLEDIYSGFKEQLCQRYAVESMSESIHAPGLVQQIDFIDKLLPRVRQKLFIEDTDELDLDVYFSCLSSAFDLLCTMARETDEMFNPN